MKYKLSFVEEDFLAWCKWKKMPCTFSSFLKLFVFYPEFRRVLDFRLFQAGGGWKILRFITLPSSYFLNLYISEQKNKGVIKGGLMFEHGFSTIIFCQSMGHNCCINQQVTVGTGRGGAPIIGNNVRIYSGAKVIGNITVGDGSVIGANAVVTRDVPPHTMVAGVPAKIIKKRDGFESPWYLVIE